MALIKEDENVEVDDWKITFASILHGNHLIRQEEAHLKKYSQTPTMTAKTDYRKSGRTLSPLAYEATVHRLRIFPSISSSYWGRCLPACALLLLADTPSLCCGWSPMKLSAKASSISISRKVGGTGSKVKRVLKKIAPFSLSSASEDADVSLLQSENFVLRDTVRQLEEENQKLKQTAKIVLENFEGEGLFGGGFESSVFPGGAGITLTGDEISQDELWCDELEEGTPFFLPECLGRFDKKVNSFLFRGYISYQHLINCRSMSSRASNFLWGCPARPRLLVSGFALNAIIFWNHFKSK